MLFRSKIPSFSIKLARAALESIFDECDRYDADETGGRLIGTYRQRRGRLEIDAKDVLEPGPNAQRTATYFLQDGEYQEKVFREIEAVNPEIEHLGNWHTHHVNGFPTLSGGDVETYFRIVNHKNHNTDFFYALLVVSKNRGGNPRYNVKHFVFRRSDDNVYEIPSSEVRLVDAPLLRARNASSGVASAPNGAHERENLERAKDQDFLSEFFPDFKPMLSKDSGALYWKGRLSLIDGSRVDVVAIENHQGEAQSYSIGYACNNPALADIVQKYKRRKFPGARHAVLRLEHDLNQALYQAK